MSSPRALPIVCTSARRRAPERNKPQFDAAVDDFEDELDRNVDIDVDELCHEVDGVFLSELFGQP
jgi:hypothetical protein